MEDFLVVSAIPGTDARPGDLIGEGPDGLILVRLLDPHEIVMVLRHRAHLAGGGRFFFPASTLFFWTSDSSVASARRRLAVRSIHFAAINNSARSLASLPAPPSRK